MLRLQLVAAPLLTGSLSISSPSSSELASSSSAAVNTRSKGGKFCRSSHAAANGLSPPGFCGTRDAGGAIGPAAPYDCCDADRLSASARTDTAHEDSDSEIA